MAPSDDESGKRYFSLASKKAALENAENDGSAEYQELIYRMDDLRDEIDVCLDAI